MKRVLKKIVAVTSAMLMLVSMLNIGLTAFASGEELDVVSIEVAPLELIENYHGWEQYAFFMYDWWNYIQTTITLANGDVIERDGVWFYYNDQEYCLQYEDHQYDIDTAWRANETYYQTVSYGEVSCTFPVEIVESPVASITIEPIEIVENSGGQWTSDWYWDEEAEEDRETPQYYCYSPYEIDNFAYTVIMKDGTAVRGDHRWFEYNNQQYHVDIYFEQSYENRWLLGNTYAIDVKVLGYDEEASVTIVPSPVASIKAESIVVYQGVDSEESWYYDENDEQVCYDRYNWDHIVCTVTMQDGTVFETHPYWNFNYNGKSYYVTTGDNQGYGEVWTPGNTYTGTVSILGKTGETTITVEDTPVASIAVEPLTYMEGKTVYDDGFECGVYEWWFDVSYTVTFKDGTVKTGTYWNPVEFNGYYYGLSYDDDQYENPWTVGNHVGTIEVLGVEAEVPVTITENPVASLTVNPLTLAENQGYLDSYWYNNEYCEYYRYDWWQYMAYTITLKDGTVIEGVGNGSVEIDGKQYPIDYTDTQDYDNRWLPDNTYCETVTVLGVKTQAYITITVAEVEDGFSYIVDNGAAYITDCDKQAAYLEIPATIGGYPVVGVTGLGNAMQYAERLVIPDSVTKLSGVLFNGRNLPLQKLTLGSGITSLEGFYFDSTPQLNEVTVSANNPVLCSVDGVVYNKAVTKMILYPPARTTTHVVPKTVTNVDVFADNKMTHNGVSVEFHEGIEGYKQVDGVLYNADMTKVIAVNGNKTGDYVMPDSVETIGNCAFMNSNLESVTVSKNVTDIVYYSFAGSENLKSVTLPDNLKSIGYSAFRGCIALETIDLPEGLTVIESASFYQSGLKNVTLPSTMEYIGGYAFEASALETATLNEGLQWISALAFASTPLTSITIPDSVINLGDEAFRGCSSLTSVTLGEGISEIPYRCFNNSGVTSMVFPENIDTIGYCSFAGTNLKTVEFQNNAVNIDEGAFSGCPIETLDIPKNVSYIGQRAFEGSAITELTLPDSVTEITYRSFAFSSDLLNIDIGDNVTYIDPYAFEGTAWYDSQPEGAVYLEYVLYDYKGTMDASTDVVIKEGTRLISNGIFYGSGFIDSVHIPASVEQLDENTFSNCWVNELTVDENNPYFCVRDGALYDQNNVMIWRGTNKPVAMEIVENGKTDFVVGQALYSYHMPTVQVTYADGGTEMLTPPAWWASGFDTSSVGEKTVTITLGSLAVSYDITVEENAVEEMYVNGKTTYTLGEALDLTLNVVFVDGSWESIEEFEVIGYDAHTEGVQEITVVYGGARETLTVYVDGSMTYHGDDATDIMVNAPAGALEADTKLVVEKGTVSDVPELDEAIIENKAVAVFDITLKQNGVEVQPEGKVSVSIPVPATMDGISCTVYHIGDDGSVTDMRAQFRNGCMVFDTDGFSYYVLVSDKGAVMGDLNDDGIVDIADATVAFRASNGRIVLTSEQKAVADVNKDGIVNIADATMLFRFANGRLASID